MYSFYELNTIWTELEDITSELGVILRAIGQSNEELLATFKKENKDTRNTI